MFRFSTLLCICLLSCRAAVPPEPAPVEAASSFVLPADDAPIPSDPDVRVGTLDNGLTYYIEPNAYPEDRAELRLVVKAGSVLEDEDQQGLAHLVEHMAFNGSENFEGNELIAYMESLGAEFGPHVNAYTSFDRTVYMLFVPTDDGEALDTGLTVLRDWAGGVSFVTEEIEKERGVVLEEWRRRQGPGTRIQEQLLPLTYHDSKYAERLPIGTKESLEGFEPDAVRRFYGDWYRPELMAVVVVGAVDVDAMEQEIRERFSDLSGPEEPRPREDMPVPDHAQMLVGVATDPEVTYSAVAFGAKVDAPQGNTHGWMKTHVAEQLVAAALNERFGDLAQDPEAPFLGAGLGRSPLNADRALVQVGARAKEGRELESLEVMLVEVERLQRHGLTQAELDRAKANMISGYDRMYKEREATHSRTHADEIVRVFTTGEFMCGITYERDMVAAVLAGLTLEDVNAVAAEGVPEGSRVLTVIMPEKEGLAVPSEQALRDLVAEVATRDIAPPEGEVERAPLMSALPEPGTITARERIEALDLTVLTLSNGATVMLKPTDFKADEVVLTGWSPGGRSLVGEEGQVPAATASVLASASGLAELDARELSKTLAGRQAYAGVGLGTFYETVSGGSSAEEVELMLQLVHLRFTAPRWDEEAFTRDKASREESLRNKDANPDVRFNEAVTKLEWQDHWYLRPWTVADLEDMDLSESQAFYEARFADASEFTFLIVGSFELEAIEPLLERYLASLPTLNDGAEAWVDPGYRRVEGEQELIFHAGQEPKAQVAIRYHGPVEDDRLLRNQLGGLTELLDTLLTEELREARGGVYSVSVGGGITDKPVPTYNVTIRFTCDPERVDELRAATEEVLEGVRTAPVDAAYIDRVIKTRRREHETNLRDNGYWARAISGSVQRGEDPVEILEWDARNESFTAELAMELAGRFTSGPNVLVTVMLPGE
ncbi:MAG: insulinase family protein [Alphaproteobacteria bacterium]|nr:insulinase family protein [Alphaproteobacteria bacterium]